ncbi:MAG: carboxypeptidase [Pseudolabrys sp.]
MTARIFRAIVFVLVLGVATPVLAQQSRDGGHGGGQKADSSSGVLSLLPPDSVTEHTIDGRGHKLAYTATAGTLNLYKQSGERSAAIFYTAYVLKGARAANRPLTFVFNGGPGAASAYLHLGLVGPKLLDFGPDARNAGNAQLRDNPDTWLAFTDLVLIDPVGTGWSRAANQNDLGSFLGVRADAQVLAKTIALYLTHSGRSASPKYLLGESYGGLRAAKVARAAQDEQGVVINGIVMLSPLLEGSFQFGNRAFALGAALQLPSLAAAELERKHAFTPAALADAEHFAMTDYLTTLAGPEPQGAAAQAFYARVAQMTGLPVDLVTRSRGFIHDLYVKNLRGSERNIVSPYDVTFAAPDPFPESTSHSGDDPILDGLTRAYGGAFADYARNELGFKTEMTYSLLASDVTRKWDWHGGRASVSASEDLRELLALNPAFKLMVAHGYSDLVTPYSDSRYVLDHLPRIGPPGRVELKLYRGGHMLYLDPKSRAAFTTDARAFYGAAPE